MICDIYDLPICLTIWKLENWPKLGTQVDCQFMNFDINCLEGRYVWSESQKETRYQIWWDRVFSIGREPNGNGDCVFKDGYKEPDGKWGWNQFGWADFPCDADFWSKQAIHALCETNHFPNLIWSNCPDSQVHVGHQYSLWTGISTLYTFFNH